MRRAWLPAGLMMAAVTVSPAPAEPMPDHVLSITGPCWPRDEIVKSLELGGFVRTDIGISSVPGWTVERWLGPDGEFTILAIDADNDACRISSGHGMKSTGAMPGRGA